eukprot:TRINITY_DN824_c0_g1_i1.p1 TRINITY_DN824_c0_g1~~TRINITY_DN824_c0_g1_i1.p1  ORF type:complete len:114 (+),score=63.18 TRINITY_DN824_c0_g1_i1:146-487(+)
MCIRDSPNLQTFLEANEETLAQAKRQSVDPPKKQAATGGLGRWFKEAFQSASNTLSAPQEFVDPAYEEQKQKIEELKEQVVTLKRYTEKLVTCLLYTSPSPRDRTRSRMPSSA